MPNIESANPVEGAGQADTGLEEVIELLQCMLHQVAGEMDSTDDLIEALKLLDGIGKAGLRLSSLKRAQKEMRPAGIALKSALEDALAGVIEQISRPVSD